MLLIVGFLSFNGGSLGTITNAGDGATVARVMINTLLAASGGSVTILALTKLGFFGPSTWNFSLTLNAAITGMVSQLPPCPTCSCVLTHFYPRTLLIALKMEAVSISETSAYFYETTQRNITEGCHNFSRRLENLTSL
jgi:hypothetical protein